MDGLDKTKKMRNNGSGSGYGDETNPGFGTGPGAGLRKSGWIWHILLAALLLANAACLWFVLTASRSGEEPAKEDGAQEYALNVRLTQGEASRLCWAGKTWCSYGDSITQEAAWQSYVTEYFGLAKHYNRGIGSCTFAVSDQTWYANEDGSYHSRFGFDGVTEAPEGTTEHEGYLCSSDRINVSVPEDVDLILVMGGTNDMGSDVPLGDLTYPFDETTFKGAVAATVVKLQKKAPGAVVVLASPLSGRGVDSGEESSLPANRDEEAFAVNGLGLTTEDYRDAMEEVARTLSIPFIDVYGTTGINQWNRSQYIRDVVHPSERGGMALARSVIGGLEGIKPNMISRANAVGQIPAGSATVRETEEGLSAQLDQIRWQRTEEDGKIFLTGILPETLESGGFSVDVSDPDYFRNIKLEISEDGENWQELYAGLQYECWGDSLWADFPRTKIRQIRFGYEKGSKENGVFRFGFYQAEDAAGSFHCGSRIRKLSASVNGDQVNNMTDHDLSTRWTSGSAQKEGVWVMAELTEDCVVDGLRMELSDSIGDFPQALRIETSGDGENWTEQEAVSGDQIDFHFDPVRCRYIRLTLGEIPEDLMANWSIHELILFGGGQADQ